MDDWPFGEDPGPPAHPFPSPPLCTARVWSEARKVHSNQDTGEETKQPWWEDTEEVLRRMLIPAEKTGVTGEASAPGLGLCEGGRRNSCRGAWKEPSTQFMLRFHHECTINSCLDHEQSNCTILKLVIYLVLTSTRHWKDRC